MKIDRTKTAADLSKPLERLFELAIAKTRALNNSWDPAKGSPVFTINGKFSTRGWTEWTQGFQYGCAILTFDATDDKSLLDSARRNVVNRMAEHITHTGVHDHGFNTISTYGNLRRLMRDGRLPANEWELAFYELAIKASGAVQAARWTQRPTGGGFIYSFNGPHSLFIDTMRTLRVLGLAHQLGHVLMIENDQKINLLERLLAHAQTTAEHNIYYGNGRDAYDVKGRTAHEAIFNTNNGSFRCPNSQQGYSPFTSWTRGLAWAILGFAEELEFLRAIGEQKSLAIFEKAARATADFYIDHATAADGIPYWDTGAPGLAKLEGCQDRPANPFNDHEPVDSSAAAIAAQGLIRLGKCLETGSARYFNAGLMIAATLLNEPYISTDPAHQGLLLHSVYHRPNGWDHIPPGRKVPCGESSMWGDYHLLELGVLIARLAAGNYLTFFDRP
jgi:unsaturated chondroitin disaccharide hydrolase